MGTGTPPLHVVVIKYFFAVHGGLTEVVQRPFLSLSHVYICGMVCGLRGTSFRFCFILFSPRQRSTSFYPDNPCSSTPPTAHYPPSSLVINPFFTVLTSQYLIIYTLCVCVVIVVLFLSLSSPLLSPSPIYGP